MEKFLNNIANGDVKGTYNISELKLFNDQLVAASENSQDAKSALTELRSLPYKCDTSKTKLNAYGRISVMHFEQEVDSDILNSGI